MQTKQDNPSFFDGKTLIAIVLVGFFWFVWERHLQKKYPEAYKPKPEVQQEIEGKEASVEAQGTIQATETPVGSKESQVAEKPDEEKSSVGMPEETLSFEDGNWKFLISSKGMSVKSLTLNSYTDRENKNISLGDGGPMQPLTTTLGGVNQPIDFKLEKISENTFKGTADVSGMKIEKTLEIHSKTYSMGVKTKVSGIQDSLVSLKTYLFEHVDPLPDMGFFKSLLNPSYEHQQYYVVHDNTSKSEMLMPNFEFKNHSFNNLKLIAFGSQYFALALVDRSSIIPRLDVAWEKKGNAITGFLGAVTHEMINKNTTFETEMTAFMGPKSLDIVSEVDPELSGVVNFGFFSSLGRPLLWVMKFFYNLTHNYGFAIILLTILVRMLILPLNIMGYQSMKKMQMIQPQLKALNEKYKNDSQARSMATMALFKEHKVNPMGGCIPMLLQLPIFFALYQVFAQSIELYKSPFVLWIHDLSSKDPYFVLPIAMAAVMFFQQKMTPTTMDPQQQKVMLMVPVLFSLFMLGLPSGLSLYMFVSGLFGILQQLYFMKDKSTVTVAKLEIV